MNRLSGRGKSEENKGREGAKRQGGDGEGRRGRGKGKILSTTPSSSPVCAQLALFSGFSPTGEPVDRLLNSYELQAFDCKDSKKIK